MSSVRIPILPPTVDVAHRRLLTDQIYRLLLSNGSNTRGVYDGLDTGLPKGGLRQLYNERPYDGIRCEIGGTTLTVEITNRRHGEQDDADALRFATYDYTHFVSWFYSLLRRAGQPLQPPAVTGLPKVMPDKVAEPLRPDLRSAPIIHHRRKQKGGRR